VNRPQITVRTSGDGQVGLAVNALAQLPFP
jgi:hypothetical protein